MSVQITITVLITFYDVKKPEKIDKKYRETKYSYYINGKIDCHASNINEVIKKVFDKVV